MNVTTQRGVIETRLILLACFDGINPKTKVIVQYCCLGWRTGVAHIEFLEEHGFLIKVPHKGSRHTYARTEKGDKVISVFMDELQELGDVLSDIYKKIEYDKTMVHLIPWKGRRPIDELMLDVLKLLGARQRYPVSRIRSYAHISQNSIVRVITELERNELITLYPNRYKQSKGDYGISSKGMTHLLDASRKKR